MSFSVCLNKNEVLLLAGFGLLFQGLDLDRKSKLVQDSQRLLCSVIEILERREASGAAEFKRVVCAMISIERFSMSARTTDDSDSQGQTDGSMTAPANISKPGRKLQAIASRFSTSSVPVMKHESDNGRRSTAPTVLTREIPYYPRSNSQNSVSSAMSDPLAAQYSKRMSISNSPHHNNDSLKPPNLDYLSFTNDPVPGSDHTAPNSNSTAKYHDQNGYLNGGLEGQPSLDNLCASADIFSSYVTPSPSANVDWCSDIWNMTPDMNHHHAQSRVSFSEEELTSGEELSNCELGGEFTSMTIPTVDDLVGLESLDGNFGM